MADDDVSFRLSKAESLVLFEWLAKLDSLDSLPCEHPAEEKVLWRLQAQLEKALVEPLAPNYNEAIAEARCRVMEDK